MTQPNELNPAQLCDCTDELRDCRALFGLKPGQSLLFAIGSMRGENAKLRKALELQQPDPDAEEAAFERAVNNCISWSEERGFTTDKSELRQLWKAARQQQSDPDAEAFKDWVKDQDIAGQSDPFYMRCARRGWDAALAHARQQKA